MTQVAIRKQTERLDIEWEVYRNGMTVLVTLLDRTEHGNGVVVYTVQSGSGEGEYEVTLVNGRSTGCECPSWRMCKHARACVSYERFLVEWNAPVVHEIVDMAAAQLDEIAPDVEDDIRTGAFPTAGELWAISKREAEQKRAVAPLNGNGLRMELSPFGTAVPMA